MSTRQDSEDGRPRAGDSEVAVHPGESLTQASLERVLAEMLQSKRDLETKAKEDTQARVDALQEEYRSGFDSPWRGDK